MRRFATSSRLEPENSSEIVVHTTAEQVPESAVEYGKGQTMKITTDSTPIFETCVLFISLHAACFVDPSFLYIPLINEERKCVRLHQELKIILLILRSLIDLSITLSFVSRLVHFFKNRKQTIDWWITAYFTTMAYIYAVFPLPQVATLFFLTKRRGFTSSTTQVLLNTSLLVQNYLRIVITVLFSGRLRNYITNKSSGGISFWLDGYMDNFQQVSIIAYSSHLLGAFWYFLSYQREINCWLHACQSVNGCELLSSLDCNDRHVFSNVTVLNDLCPINPANAKVFDFGIFLDALQSGMLGSTNFPQKCLHCFWWGLRNLSSLGQNLYTSTYIWEDFFAIFICMFGMTIFLQYLNLLVQSAGEKIKSLRKSKEKERECSMRLHEIQSWEVENDLPPREWDREEEIKINLKEGKLRADKEINLKTFLSIINQESARSIKLHLCMPTLQKVPLIQNLIEERLELLLESLKPAIYDEGSHIFREREPIDKVVIITRGVVLTYTSSANETQGHSSTVKGLQKGDFCGEEILLHWKSIQATSCFDLPISNMVVKCSTRVEAFIIMANDLHSFVN